MASGLLDVPHGGDTRGKLAEYLIHNLEDALLLILLDVGFQAGRVFVARVELQPGPIPAQGPVHARYARAPEGVRAENIELAAVPGPSIDVVQARFHDRLVEDVSGVVRGEAALLRLLVGAFHVREEDVSPMSGDLPLMELHPAHEPREERRRYALLDYCAGLRLEDGGRLPLEVYLLAVEDAGLADAEGEHHLRHEEEHVLFGIKSPEELPELELVHGAVDGPVRGLVAAVFFPADLAQDFGEGLELVLGEPGAEGGERGLENPPF